nr:MAG TPA: hypothetical protein [Caudoviricetes sp.]
MSSTYITQVSSRIFTYVKVLGFFFLKKLVY